MLTDKKKAIIIFSIIAGIILLIVVGITVSNMMEKAYSDKIKNGIENGELSENADKIVLYNVKEDMYSDEFIPKEYRAKEAEDVRFVVKLTARTTIYGRYSKGGNAYQYVYDVELLDRQVGEIVLTESFVGGTPPQVIKNSRNGYGSKPDDKLEAWIRNKYSSLTK